MLAVCYLILAYGLGFALCRFFFPNLPAFVEQDFSGRKLNVSPLFLMLPAWLYLGVFPLAWLTYLLAFVFHGAGNPLPYANGIAMGAAVLVSALLLWLSFKRRPFRWNPEWLSAVRPAELAAAAAIGILITFLMFWTLRVQDGQLYIGWSVFGDFTPHLSMIRSFSRGINFPTVYTPYAGSDVKYHFLYMFFCGNLEFLGLRIDIAFSLPTVIGFLSTVSLLYVLALKLSGRRSAGLLAAGMFLFRSSSSIWTFLGEQPKGEALHALLSKNEFLGYSPNEDWGLWTLNVYVNQRHFAFTLGVLLLFVMLYIQIFMDGFRRLESYPKATPEEGTIAWAKGWVVCFFRESLISKDGWKPVCPEYLRGPGPDWISVLIFPLAAGLSIGMLAFWNGAVVIACLLVLFVLAMFSDGRLSYLLTAIVAVSLTLLQSRMFIQESAFSLKFFFGFIAANKTVFGVLRYISLMTGLLFLIIPACFAAADGRRRCLFAAFSAPFLFAFTISLTVDPAVNHKYIMVSLMLVSVLAAGFLAELFFAVKKFLLKAGILVLCVCLMATGAFEALIVVNLNKNSIRIPMDDETTAWIMENTGHGDIFLTGLYSINNVLLSGAECFEIWPYYAWSAGYNTAYRDTQAAAIYSAETVSDARYFAAKNKIAYIVVDDDNRNSREYTLREDVLAQAFPAVFSSPVRNLVIYQVTSDSVSPALDG